MTREDEYQRIARVMEGFAAQVVNEEQRARYLEVVKVWRQVGALGRPKEPVRAPLGRQGWPRP